MKIIIGSKIYDIDKSKTIATIAVGVLSKKVIYKTEKERYYSVLYMPFGEARALSLVEETVKKLLIDNNMVDEYVKEFGELEYA